MCCLSVSFVFYAMIALLCCLVCIFLWGVFSVGLVCVGVVQCYCVLCFFGGDVFLFCWCVVIVCVRRVLCACFRFFCFGSAPHPTHPLLALIVVNVVVALSVFECWVFLLLCVVVFVFFQVVCHVCVVVFLVYVFLFVLCFFLGGGVRSFGVCMCLCCYCCVGVVVLHPCITLRALCLWVCVLLCCVLCMRVFLLCVSVCV